MDNEENSLVDEKSESPRNRKNEEFLSFFNEFTEESDRAAVILGAAKLDLLLYQILQKALRPCPTGQDELMDGDAPLSTFSSKINLIHRMGIISSDFARVLHIIRKIRNTFAHEMASRSLDLGSHRDRVAELISPFRHLPIFESTYKTFFQENSGPSYDFRYALTCIIMRLEVILENIKEVQVDPNGYLLPQNIV
ncbi:MAG: hypothetical protein NTZ27_01450 [Ignavibacteriales bacterium]|nr:hypothetical protein [Ignavibacteriales bacterium]